MDFEAAQAERLYVRGAYARARRQDRSRTSHQIQRRKRRTRSAATSRPASLDRKVYLHKAGDTLRVRQSPARSGRPHVANVFEEKGRYKRSAQDFISLARVLGA